MKRSGFRLGMLLLVATATVSWSPRREGAATKAPEGAGSGLYVTGEVLVIDGGQTLSMVTEP